MKHTKKFLGIAAVIAVIVFMALPLTGCPDGGDDTKPAPKPEAGPPPVVGNDTPITSVSITITPPTADRSPVTTAAATGTTVNYTIGTVTWSPADDPFVGDEEYTATVTLTANTGYTFTGLTTGKAKINNQNATIVGTPGATLTLSYIFMTLPPVSSVAVTAQPKKLIYNQDDTLDLDELMITVYFATGAPRNIEFADFGEYNVTTSLAQGEPLSVSAHNGQKITVTVGGKSKETNALTVNPRAPTVTDFIISGAATFTYNGTARSVSVTADPAKTSGMGAITVKYDGSETAPTNAKTSYAVTFDVATNINYNAATLSAGTLTINKATPVLGDYDTNVTPTTQFVTNVSAINITATAAKKTSGLRSDGVVTVYYEGTSGTSYTRSATKPNKVGTFAVTFDVAGTENWNAATGLNAGTLEINVFKAIADLGTWLGQQTANTAATAFPVALNVSSFGGTTGQANQAGSIGATLLANFTKYVSLDLSGSTFNAIPRMAFLVPGETTNACINLVSVTIPNTVTSIGQGAFSDCSGLTNINIPANVTSIGLATFLNCTSLANITIPDSVTSIGEAAFQNCSSLTNINIPANVTSIGQNAFFECINLFSVTFATGSNIPDANFGYGAFGNDSLKNAYSTGKAGTYTRSAYDASTWSKQ